MAQPIIIIKENPGTLKIEIFDDDTKQYLWQKSFPDVAFNIDSELEVDGSAKTKVKPKKDGNLAVVEIKIRSAEGADR
jgi:hypothetical protein